MKGKSIIIFATAMVSFYGCLGWNSDKHIAEADQLQKKCPIKVSEHLTLQEAYFSPTYQMILSLEGDTILKDEPTSEDKKTLLHTLCQSDDIDKLVQYFIDNKVPMRICLNEGKVAQEDVVADSTAVEVADSIKTWSGDYEYSRDELFDSYLP